MQEPHHGDRHDSPGVATLLVVAALLALTVVAPARATAPRRTALPSAAAQLSPTPPLGIATTSEDAVVAHRVSARTVVDISVDHGGRPFAVAATQRLDVRGKGDYYFGIAGPVLEARAAAGSDARPGLRDGTILWEGFDPGRRLLAVRATLDVARTRGDLPLRVVRGRDETTLVNVTEATVDTYTADAEREPLLAYLAGLRADLAHGQAPRPGFATVVSEPKPARVTVRAPLHVTGTIGSRSVDLELDRRAVVPSSGAVDLHVTPVQRVALGTAARQGGRALLEHAIRVSLVVARARQYDAFLANPDPAGTNLTTYVYRTARRPSPPAIAVSPRSHGRSGLETALIAVAIIASLAGAAALWARS